MKTSKNMKLLLILSAILLIAFSGCTAPSEQANGASQGDAKTPQGDMKTSQGDVKTSQGDVKTSQGDVKISGGKENVLASCVKGELQKLPMGRTQQIMGVVDYKGNPYCLAVITDEWGTIEAYGNGTYEFTIFKDLSGNVVTHRGN